MKTSGAKRLRAVLERARALARSGDHGDHRTIEVALRRMKDFAEARHWLHDERFRSQLDQLCARAKEQKRLAAARRPRLRLRPRSQEPVTQERVTAAARVVAIAQGASAGRGMPVGRAGDHGIVAVMELQG